MARIWWFCVPVLLATVTMATDLSPELIDYTTSLIQYLSEQEPGSFDCWFYEYTKLGLGLSVLDPIVSSEKLALIPKRILYSVGEVQVSRQPSVLVMFCDDYVSAIELYVSFLYYTDFDQFMKIIVFYESDMFLKLVRVFNIMILYEVIFIRTDSLHFGQHLHYTNQSIRRSEFVPFDEVFVDQVRDLAGYVVKMSTGRDSTFVTRKSTGRRAIFSWIIYSIFALNGSFQVQRVPGRTLDDFSTTLYNFNGTRFDICLDILSATDSSQKYKMHSVVPNSFCIVVPRGRKLDALEIFVAPFTVEVWIILLIAAASASIITMIWSNIFRNDIILLSLCGIENRDLRRTSLLEKMVITSLTVLFFVLASAFEAKMISLMTSSPHLPDPRTLDDMIRNNITIQNSEFNYSVFGDIPDPDPKLKQVYRYHHHWPPHILRFLVDTQDPTQAYFKTMADGKFMVDSPSNLNPPPNHCTLRILDGFSAFSVGFYPIHKRSPLRRKLARMEMVFFESGILHLLERNKFRAAFGTIHNSAVSNPESSSTLVGLKELELAWYVLAIGLGISSLVFVLELIRGTLRGSSRSRRRSAWVH